MKPPRMHLVCAALFFLSLATGCTKAEAPAPDAKAEARTPQTQATTAVATREAKPAPSSPTAAGPKLCQHGVPAELCTQCSPELSEVFKEKGDWCSSHDVPESHCFKCNPSLTFASTQGPEAGEAHATVPQEAWCGEHGVPEAKCTKCKPQLIAKFIEAGDFCREHGFPESVCPYCHPEVVKAAGHTPPVFPPPDMEVKLSSPELEKKAGLQTTRAASQPFAPSLEVVGQLDFNHNRLAQLSARGEALVAKVEVDIGDRVKAGESLVVLTSAGVGESQGKLSAARARLETARAALQREEGLASRGISSRREVEEAQAALAEAQGEYQAATASLNAAGAGTGGSEGRYTLTAPFAGIVVSRTAVVGKTASPDETLIEVADMTTLWAILDVPEEAASQVHPGQPVTLFLDGRGTPLVEAKVSRVAASVDKETRTVRVRVDVANPDGALKAGHYLRARIQTGSEREAVLLPRDAIQEAEGRKLAFVRLGPGVFKPVAVELGAPVGEAVPVFSGLTAGVEVVTTGAFLLKTEILKDSIGAGCVDD
ncbi:efflux RND transporter periplasmic adaptor subunit [Myxococcus xanthus]|uniref:Efflux RND transporter periplasmic adaptor subunit n=1 Tax=Myxococcus xanthus TaxID=34 RepID=A0A7Y4IJE4_MYXXA|nr:efflux RND transporter periplasmic adaptor subunit [Myxococcus xanthus]NOJ84919.1 efflux RND transporter periplasmic adaptor subunit [Myxococcus xanthus]